MELFCYSCINFDADSTFRLIAPPTFAFNRSASFNISIASYIFSLSIFLFVFRGEIALITAEIKAGSSTSYSETNSLYFPAISSTIGALRYWDSIMCCFIRRTFTASPYSWIITVGYKLGTLYSMTSISLVPSFDNTR